MTTDSYRRSLLGSTARFLPPEAVAHYSSGYEAGRLLQGGSRVEFARTKQILRRFLPPPPVRILDIGGGPGVYAAWLAQLGYRVHLLDALPLHVEQARERASHQPDHPFVAELGDARELPYADECTDAVLLLGPLYHLTQRSDRLRALCQARRVLRPGGVVVAAAISRYASLLDGLRPRPHGYKPRGYAPSSSDCVSPTVESEYFVDDPVFRCILERDLKEGQHRNLTHHPDYFTTAYFHRPEDLTEELAAAGLAVEAILGVEGPAWLLPDLDDWWDDERRRERLLRLVADVEAESSLIGMSAHLIAIAHKA